MLYETRRFLLLYVALPCVLVGCKAWKWAEHAVPQIKESQIAQSIEEKYLRFQKVYRQASTVASIAALCLSDEVQQAYVDSYVYRHFSSKQEKQALLRRLKHENTQTISFYIAGSQRSVEYENSYQLFAGTYRKPGQLLGGQDPSWVPHLRIDGKEHAPITVKSVQVPDEYKEFFGNQWSQFKTTYLLEFSAYDPETKKPYIEDGQPHTLELVFRGVYKEMVLTWQDIKYNKE